VLTGELYEPLRVQESQFLGPPVASLRLNPENLPRLRVVDNALDVLLGGELRVGGQPSGIAVEKPAASLRSEGEQRRARDGLEVVATGVRQRVGGKLLEFRSPAAPVLQTVCTEVVAGERL
jgi:hypothetical protein